MIVRAHAQDGLNQYISQTVEDTFSLDETQSCRGVLPTKRFFFLSKQERERERDRERQSVRVRVCVCVCSEICSCIHTFYALQCPVFL